MTQDLRDVSAELAVSLIFLGIMIAGVLLRLYLIVPLFLALYFIYEMNRPKKLAPWGSKKINNSVWFALLVLVVAALNIVLINLSSTGSQSNQSQVSTAPSTSIAPATTAGTSSSIPTTSVASSTTTVVTSSIIYKTASATAATSGYGSGSIFLPSNYSVYLCGGSSTSTSGVSWSQNVSVPGFTSVGMNKNGTCTIYNANVGSQFNSREAALAGAAVKATGYSAFTAKDSDKVAATVNNSGSLIIAILVGNSYSASPYFMPSSLVIYPQNAGFNCNTTEQQTTTQVRVNSTAFVTSTATLIVCGPASKGSYIFTENLTNSSMAAYVFSPR